MTQHNDLPLIHDSLLRRMQTMTSLYRDAVDTMTLDHVNHVDAPGRLPMAFPLFHYVNLHDGAFAMITGQPEVWDDDWQARVQPTFPFNGKDEPVADMVAQRIGDYDGFKEYQATVFDRTLTHLETMDADDFHRVVVPPPYPALFQGTYGARCAGPQGITVLDAFECWHYQHGLRHIGEIELARGFLGLGGLTA